MDIDSLQRLMGHSGVTVLMRYLDLATEDVQHAHVLHSPVDHIQK